MMLMLQAFLNEVRWDVVNTTLILGGLGYLWRQSRLIDSLRHVLLGYNGDPGMTEEVKLVRQRTVELLAAVQHLTATMQALSDRMGQVEDRRMRRR